MIRKGFVDDMFCECESICKVEEFEFVVELKGVGVEVEFVWNLVNVIVRYFVVILIFMDYLKKLYLDCVCEGIVCVLVVKEVRG